MIEVAGLTKTFKAGIGLLDVFKKRQIIKALDGINLNVEAGQICALLGPNGAGKTTLIKILCSLLLPDCGRVLINGCDVYTYKGSKLAKNMVGLVVGEERSFYWRLTGLQNLKFFATLYNIPSKKALYRITQICDVLEINDINRRYQEYSTGMKQRLAIARCLLSDARVVFMDEPTRSLDPLVAKNLRDFICKKMVREDKRTVLLSTHQISEAESVADKIAVISEGRIKAQGKMKELHTKYGNSNADLGEIFKWAVSL